MPPKASAGAKKRIPTAQTSNRYSSILKAPAPKADSAKIIKKSPEQYAPDFSWLGWKDLNPRNDGARTRCLTTWLHPKTNYLPACSFHHSGTSYIIPKTVLKVKLFCKNISFYRLGSSKIPAWQRIKRDSSQKPPSLCAFMISTPSKIFPDFKCEIAAERSRFRMR